MEQNFLKELELKTEEIIKYFRGQLSAIRGSRPSPKLVEDIPVEYFGQKLAIKQLASIAVAPPREIQITIWDKQIVSGIAKAIESSNLNVSANVEGNLIRINLPPLSEERRRELIKIVKKEAEETRIKLRHLRDDINKKIVHELEAKKITKDDKFQLKEKVQEFIDKTNSEIEKILETKIKEINE
jgi:ribosome recycling factor